MNELRITFAGIEATHEQPHLFDYLLRVGTELNKQRFLMYAIAGITEDIEKEVEETAEVIIMAGEESFDSIRDIEKEMPLHTYDFLKRSVYKYIKQVLTPILEQDW